MGCENSGIALHHAESCFDESSGSFVSLAVGIIAIFVLTLNCMCDHRGHGSGTGKLVLNLTNPSTDWEFRMGSFFVSALL